MVGREALGEPGELVVAEMEVVAEVEADMAMQAATVEVPAGKAAMEAMEALEAAAMEAVGTALHTRKQQILQC